MRDAAFRSAGITFTVYGEGEGIERTFPMDLVPRHHPGRRVGPPRGGPDPAGHRAQPVPRRPLRRRPGRDQGRDHPEVARHEQRRVPARRPSASPVPHGARCLVAGIDIVRDAEGTYRVLEDNLRNPSGVSYVLENRAAMTRVLPERVRRPPRAPGRPLRPVAAQRAPPGQPRGRRPRADRRRAHPGRLQLRLLRARLPRPPDGRGAGRGPRPRGRRPRRVDAHHPRAQAGRRDLPAHRRRVPRPGRVPARLRSSASPG